MPAYPGCPGKEADKRVSCFVVQMQRHTHTGPIALPGPLKWSWSPVCVNERLLSGGYRNSLVEEKRRLEARVAQLEEEMDEERVELEQVNERARKSAAQVC